MTQKILYLGDTSLCTAAAYLAGVLTHYRIPYDYQASDTPFDEDLLQNEYSAIIISDYPAGNFKSLEIQRQIIDKVIDGMGLIMIGGWESFTGKNVEYYNTEIAKALPVILDPSDDRVNLSGPCLVEKMLDHPIVDDLPWQQNPPAIGGYNRITPKPDSRTILQARRFQVEVNGCDYSFNPLADPAPLLVTGTYGKGRTLAFATDAAPHWVGPLVDWGQSRIEAQAKGTEAIEVGSLYAEFFMRIVRWTTGML